LPEVSTVASSEHESEESVNGVGERRALLVREGRKVLEHVSLEGHELPVDEGGDAAAEGSVGGCRETVRLRSLSWCDVSVTGMTGG
jgi:hypothetical protein